jgi:septum formation protein
VVAGRPYAGPVPHLVLASASPARLGLLRAAGFDPEVVVSGVDETHVVGTPEGVAGALAEHKALAVTERLGRGEHLVVGCDTVVVHAGEQRGKPASAEVARQWWEEAAGGELEVVTGHAVVDGRDARMASEVSSTLVRLGKPEPSEIDAYLATGEPFSVAGGLTIDGYGAAFVERIDGDHGTVVGLSVPVLRRLVQSLGVAITSLWREPRG